MGPRTHHPRRDIQLSASVTNGDPGGVVASCEVVDSHIPDTGAEEVDGVGIPRTQSDSATYSLVKRVGSLNDKKQSPLSSVQPTHMHSSAAGSADNVGSELQSSTESSSSHDKHGSGNDEGGEQGSEELDSMLPILDATLLLPPSERPHPHPLGRLSEQVCEHSFVYLASL